VSKYQNDIGHYQFSGVFL